MRIMGRATLVWRTSEREPMAGLPGEVQRGHARGRALRRLRRALASYHCASWVSDKCPPGDGAAGFGRMEGRRRVSGITENIGLWSWKVQGKRLGEPRAPQTRAERRHNLLTKEITSGRTWSLALTQPRRRNDPGTNVGRVETPRPAFTGTKLASNKKRMFQTRELRQTAYCL